MAERSNQDGVIKQRKAEYEMALKRIEECDAKVEQVARKMDNLKVWL